MTELGAVGINNSIRLQPPLDKNTEQQQSTVAQSGHLARKTESPSKTIDKDLAAKAEQGEAQITTIALEAAKKAVDEKQQAAEQSFKDQSGFLGKTSDFLRNRLNGVNENWGQGGSKQTKKELEELNQSYEKLEEASKSNDKALLAKANELFEQEVKQFDEQLKKREEGNKAWNDGIATTAAIAAGTIAIAAAPVTLTAAGAISVAALAGGVTKTALKATDEVITDDGESYTLQQGYSDFATGSLDAGFTAAGGMLGKAAQVTAGNKIAGYAIGKGIEAGFDYAAGTGIEVIHQRAEGESLNLAKANQAGLTTAAAGVFLGSVMDGAGHTLSKGLAREVVKENMDEALSSSATLAVGTGAAISASKETADNGTNQTLLQVNEQALEDSMADTPDVLVQQQAEELSQAVHSADTESLTSEIAEEPNTEILSNETEETPQFLPEPVKSIVLEKLYNAGHLNNKYGLPTALEDYNYFTDTKIDSPLGIWEIRGQREQIYNEKMVFLEADDVVEEYQGPVGEYVNWGLYRRAPFSEALGTCDLQDCSGFVIKIFSTEEHIVGHVTPGSSLDDIIKAFSEARQDLLHHGTQIEVFPGYAPFSHETASKIVTALETIDPSLMNKITIKRLAKFNHISKAEMQAHLPESRSLTESWSDFSDKDKRPLLNFIDEENAKLDRSSGFISHGGNTYRYREDIIDRTAAELTYEKLSQQGVHDLHFFEAQASKSDLLDERIQYRQALIRDYESFLDLDEETHYLPKSSSLHPENKDFQGQTISDLFRISSSDTTDFFEKLNLAHYLIPPENPYQDMVRLPDIDTGAIQEFGPAFQLFSSEVHAKRVTRHFVPVKVLAKKPAHMDSGNYLTWLYEVKEPIIDQAKEYQTVANLSEDELNWLINHHVQKIMQQQGFDLLISDSGQKGNIPHLYAFDPSVLSKTLSTEASSTKALMDLQPRTVSDNQRLQALIDAPDHSLGSLPRGFESYGSHSEVIQALNDFAIHHNKMNLSGEEASRISGIPVGNQEIPVTQIINSGGHGIIFKIKLGEQDYVLKTVGGFNDKARLKNAVKDAHGLKEIAHAKDIHQWYAVGDGWNLYEFVHENTSLEARKGKTLAELGWVQSDHKAINKIGDIYIDSESIKPIEEVPWLD